MQTQKVKRIIKADRGRLLRVLEYENGARVEVPIEKDGSVVKKLVKKEQKENKEFQAKKKS